MRTLRWLHRYLGAGAAVFLVVLAVSGAVLIFKEDIWRLRYDALDRPWSPPSPTELAVALAAITTAFGERVELIRTPRPELPAYHVYLGESEALVDPATLRIIDEWAWHESVTGILAELHLHLAAGEAGRTLVGVLGVLLAAFAFSGPLLWWPMRRQFRLRSLWLADASRGQILRLHRDLGMLAALLVLLFAMTGAGVVFYDVSRSFLNALLSPGAVAPTAPAVTAATPVPPPDARTIARASARLPGGQLMSWSPPVQGSAVHLFRFRMPGEPHPFGRSTVHVDGRNGALLQVRDATQAARGERALHWLYPLHTARVGGWPYRAGVLLGGLALAILCLSGLLGFVRSFKARAAR